MKKKLHWDNVWGGDGRKNGRFLGFLRNVRDSGGKEPRQKGVKEMSENVNDTIYNGAKPRHKGVSGSGAIIRMGAPETGCVKRIRRACRQMEPSGLERGAPYFKSPLMGQPMAASCARI